jgi:hypothetical protein
MDTIIATTTTERTVLSVHPELARRKDEQVIAAHANEAAKYGQTCQCKVCTIPAKYIQFTGKLIS